MVFILVRSSKALETWRGRLTPIFMKYHVVTLGRWEETVGDGKKCTYIHTLKCRGHHNDEVAKIYIYIKNPWEIGFKKYGLRL